MQVVAAPARQAKTYSFILTVVLFALDSGMALIHTFGDAALISVGTITILNAVGAFIIGLVRFIAQTIPVTTDEKEDLIIAAASQPVKAGHEDLVISVESADDQPK